MISREFQELLERGAEIDKYIPDFMQNLNQYVVTCEALNVGIGYLIESVRRLIDNLSVDTMDKVFVEMYEDMYKIVSTNGADLTLQERREIIKNRQATKPPFTENFLRRRLDEIVGKGNYDLEINKKDYTIVLRSAMENQKWHGEVVATIYSIKPATFIFRNVPQTFSYTKVGEKIYNATRRWNYRLDGTWRLGEKPFISMGDYILRKDSEVKSLTDEYLIAIAEASANLAGKVVVNDKVEITEIKTDTYKGSDGLIYSSIEYTVAPEMVSTIKNIKIMSKQGALLSEYNLPIDVVEGVDLRHIINISDISGR